MEYKVFNKNKYKIHVIKTDKFKTIKFRVILTNKVDKDKINLRNMLMDVLTYSTKEYPTKKDLVRQTQNLYGARVYSKTYRLGIAQLHNFYLTLLNDKYTEDGMLEEGVKLLSEVIFNPNVTDNKFDSDSFDFVYKINKESLKSIKDQKSKYSFFRMLELMGNDEVYAINDHGTIEQLEMVNTSNLYDYYKELINNSRIDIYVIGDVDFDNINNLINKYLNFDNSIEMNDLMYEHSNYRSDIKIIKENDDNNQSNLAIGCKLKDLTDREKNFVLSIYNMILGSGAESKFFKNIREKNSLCYYIYSSINKFDNLLYIRSGISKENFDKVLGLINENMQDMVNGNFSEEDIVKAKTSYISFLDELLDSDEAIIETYLANEILKLGDIEQRKKEIMTVSYDEIVELSKKIIMDTVYMLEGDKNE